LAMRNNLGGLMRLPSPRRAAPLAAFALLLIGHVSAFAQESSATILSRHSTTKARFGATLKPHSEAEQAIVDGWPLYRTRRGQEAFNATMATLAATAGSAPAAKAFKCPDLACPLDLPKINAEGWLPEGRLWLSPKEYVLIVNTPRLPSEKSYRRRSFKSMRYFVYHEFHNRSHNVDMSDTISSHARSVFVPLYMSKARTDAEGYTFVTIAQVAPYDVVSVHASNKGSAGPGVEVAVNPGQALEPLQGKAGALLGAMIKQAAPHLAVVNHRGTEGLQMLRAYQQRQSAVAGGGAAVKLPFVAADAARTAAAHIQLAELILMPGAKPKKRRSGAGVAVAAAAPAIAVPTPVPAKRPAVAAQPGVSPLAAWLAGNLATLRDMPTFAGVFPAAAVALQEANPDDGVSLIDEEDQVLGRIEARTSHGAIVAGQFVYVPVVAAAGRRRAFALDLSQPPSPDSAVLLPANTAAVVPDEPVRAAQSRELAGDDTGGG
jgi:hypothetical protein